MPAANVHPPRVPYNEARAETRNARDRLIDAMDMAELLGHEIPCKEEPEEFTSDLLAFNSAQAQLLAADLAARCLACPVVAECREFVRESKRSRATRMFGVVAGYLVLPHTTHRINPEGDA